MRSILTLTFLIFCSGFSLYAQFYQRQVVSEQGIEFDIDGNTLVVSDYSNDIAYVYELEGEIWNFKQELKPGDFTGNKYFGGQVDVSGDDIIVGASHDNNNKGAVYFFHRGPDGIWEETSKVTPPVNSSSYWGGILINIHNGIATVGRNNGLPNFFHVLGQNEDFTWEVTDTLWVDSPAYIGGQESGITDSMIVIPNHIWGTPSVFIYTLQENGEWSEAEQVFPADTEGIEYFGENLSANENFIIAGTPKNDLYIGDDTLVDAGAVYLFEKINGSWTNTKRITSDEPHAGDQFGSSTAVEDNTIAIGSQYQDFDVHEEDSVAGCGAVYIFNKTTGDWQMSQKLVTYNRVENERLGRSLSLDDGILAAGGRKIFFFHQGEDCTDIPDGGAFYDVCRNCVEGTTGYEEKEWPFNCPALSVDQPVQQNISLSPNPFSEEGFNIDTQLEIKSITIRSMKGITLFNGVPDAVPDASKNLDPGIYIIDIHFQDGNVERKKVVRF